MVEDGGPVGGGGSNPRYITDEEGRKWIMKATFLGGQDHAYLRLNEGLCALLSRRVGAPVPDAAVVELSIEQLEGFKLGAAASERLAFASRLIEPREALSPETAASCPRSRLAAIVALDALVLNTDRKPEHVVVQESDGAWQPWAIDHGHTLATAHTLAGHFDATQPCLPPMDLLKHNVSVADLEPSVEAVECLDFSDVYGLIQSLPGEWVIEPDAPENLAEILHQRAKTTRQLLEPHLPALIKR
jgi:hypothetical protein